MDMYSSSTDCIFILIRSFIYDEKPAVPEFIDWNEVFNYACIHSINSIIGYVVTKYQLCSDPLIAYKFEKSMINIYGIQYRKSVQMKRLIALLNAHKIDHILMKGYVVKDLYPIPELRTYGDIDFVIKREDRTKTDDLMKSNGYFVHSNWEPVYSYRKDTEYYEIHTQLLDSDLADEMRMNYFKDVWRHTKRTNNHTFYLLNEYHFIYLIAHLAKHAARRGAGLRMYLDIALYIMHYRDEMDWKYIQQQLDELELEKFFYTVCTVCNQWFLVDPPCQIPIIEEDIIKKFTNLTMDGGIFGFQNDSGVNKLKELNNEVNKLNKAKLVMKQLFPSSKVISNRYIYLQKMPWLLPYAWIDRLLRNRKKIKRSLKTTRSIIEADDQEAQKLKILNEKIGL